MAVLDPIKVVITNILWKEEQLDAENNQKMRLLGLEKFLFKRALYRKGRFSSGATKVF
jgi:hypothetical protein